MVFVHAHSGKVVNRFSMIHDAHDGLFRVLYEQNPGNQVWQEGQTFPGSLTPDQQNIVNFSGNSYYHFFNAFGRNSYDGLGAHMRSVNNDPTIACPNGDSVSTFEPKSFLIDETGRAIPYPIPAAPPQC